MIKINLYIKDKNRKEFKVIIVMYIVEFCSSCIALPIAKSTLWASNWQTQAESFLKQNVLIKTCLILNTRGSLMHMFYLLYWWFISLFFTWNSLVFLLMVQIWEGKSLIGWTLTNNHHLQVCVPFLRLQEANSPREHLCTLLLHSFQ